MTLNLYTIASDAPFLDVLVEQVIAGFPLNAGASLPPLSQWTILVPNRRTARELREKFLALARQDAMILPRIQPIGDLEEDFFSDEAGPAGLADALSPIARHFVLQSLVHEWAESNPHLSLAQTLARSPEQAQALALSLAELVDELEIEEKPLSKIRESIDLDLAHHREALVGLLALVDVRLPQILHGEGLIGAKDRRSKLIRANAGKLAGAQPARPIIAAGSTGSIPATRTLLKTIAALPHGAVVLPGLDTGLADADWENVSPQHSQFALKQLLHDMDLKPRQVAVLGPEAGPRAWLASEVMRPSETSDAWASIMPKSKAQVREAMRGVDLLHCRDTVEEAQTIAAFIRGQLEETTGSIGVITPDRKLARRITAQLRRWNIYPADTAGEPLIGFGAARYLALLLDIAEEPKSSMALAALLHHASSRFEMEQGQASTVAEAIDVTLLRSNFMRRGLAQLPELLQQVSAGAQHGFRVHDAAVKPGSDSWPAFATSVLKVHEQLLPLLGGERASLAQHLDALMTVAQRISAAELWQGSEVGLLREMVEELSLEAHRLPALRLSEAATLLRHYLRSAKYYPVEPTTTRVSLVGLLEARLLSFDTSILAGLNEEVWPGRADTGPWLNRPMRNQLEVQQPESDIGQMAHDFVQALGGGRVILSTSEREGATPRLPSRWLLRLETILKAADYKPDTTDMAQWQQWATMLDAADDTPFAGIPLAKPPLHQRPPKISVTQVRTLLDDPYAVYARDVLGLNPIEAISQDKTGATRGNLFHLALAEFFKAHPLQPPAEPLAALLAAGKQAFALFDSGPDLQHYWWPRYERVAVWLASELHIFYEQGGRLLAESKGSCELALGDTAMKLTGKADLIAITASGTSRVYDFKTGTLPSSSDEAASFTYQLTLEAAMLALGAFKDTGAAATEQAAYIGISGRIPPGQVKLVDDDTLANSAEHLRKLEELLKGYQNQEQPYYPRANVTKEDKPRDYDHLSRYREWIVRGGAR